MNEREPRLPRRLFVAAGLAALLAAGGVSLATLGLATAPMTETFRFSRGASFAAGEEARLRGHLLPAVEDERVAVVIVGHTGTQGDEAANLSLSEERAAAARAIAVDAGIAADRITATGMGGAAPAARAPGLSDRAYETSLARVEVTLQVRR